MESRLSKCYLCNSSMQNCLLEYFTYVSVGLRATPCDVIVEVKVELMFMQSIQAEFCLLFHDYDTFSHIFSSRVTTRSMTLRDRGDELGADSVKCRDAIVQVLQKSQQFMEIGGC